MQIPKAQKDTDNLIELFSFGNLGKKILVKSTPLLTLWFKTRIEDNCQTTIGKCSMLSLSEGKYPIKLFFFGNEDFFVFAVKLARL